MADGEDTMAVALRRRRFTLDEYHRMGETDILVEDDRVELIEGEIIEMTPIGSRHAATVARIQHLPESWRAGARSIADRAAVPTTTSASRARPSRSLPPASPTLR